MAAAGLEADHRMVAVMDVQASTHANGNRIMTHIYSSYCSYSRARCQSQGFISLDL